MLLKPEPLKNLDWMTNNSLPNGFDNRDLLKSFQQLYSQKFIAAKKSNINPASLLMRYIYNYNINCLPNHLDLGRKTSPFKPYLKGSFDYEQNSTNNNEISDEKSHKTCELEDSKLSFIKVNGIRVATIQKNDEKLICLPQILNILKSIDLNEINNAMNQLGIICVECDEDNIQLLQKHQILPKQIQACGLINLQNVEKILKYFQLEIELDDTVKASSSAAELLDSCHLLRVTHDCFGQQKGLMFPLKYTSPHSNCIECLDCGKMLSPRDFVGHTHQDGEERWGESNICHWGFESGNWRWYLRLSEDYTRTSQEEESLNDYLDEIKRRFCTSMHELPPRGPNQNPSNISQSLTENHFKSLYLSGSIFQQCVATINNNSYAPKEDKNQLLNALFLLRHEHLQQINNLISERQLLLENFIKKPSKSGLTETSLSQSNSLSESSTLLQNIKTKSSFLKHKRLLSLKSLNDQDNKTKDAKFLSDYKECSEPKKRRLGSPLLLDCCDSNVENFPIYDSNNNNIHLNDEV